MPTRCTLELSSVDDPAGLLAISVIFLFSGVNPLYAIFKIFSGSFGSLYGIKETVTKAIPLILIGGGLAVAFRAKFWNIGAEGQLTFGGIAASWVALFWSPFLPSWMVLPLAILVGMLAGAFWAGIPALLKVRLKVDEVLTTLMLNYVAILFAEHLYYGPWRDPKGFGFPGTPQFPDFTWLPRIAGRAHLGLIFALVLALVLWFILNRTRWGFELQVIGNNPGAAQTQGIKIAKNIMIALLLAGALAGLAGVCEVTGISRRLQQGLSIGYGYTAIIVAWLAQLNPIAAIFVALLIAALLVGGDQVQMMMGLPAAMGLVLQGMLLFPMLAGSLFTEYRLRIIRTQIREAQSGG